MSSVPDPLAAESPYPFQRTLGFRITDWSDGHARLELPLAEHLMNRYGIPHGGVYAAVLDTALGFSGSYTGSAETKRLAMTLSLTVNYLSRPKGTLLIVYGRRTGGGQKTFFAEGRVEDETGELIASASGAFRIRGSTEPA